MWVKWSSWKEMLFFISTSRLDFASRTRVWTDPKPDRHHGKRFTSSDEDGEVSSPLSDLHELRLLFWIDPPLILMSVSLQLLHCRCLEKSAVRHEETFLDVSVKKDSRSLNQNFPSSIMKELLDFNVTASESFPACELGLNLQETWLTVYGAES